MNAIRERLETRLAIERAWIAGVEHVLRHKLVYGEVPGFAERKAKAERLASRLAQLDTPIGER